MRFESSPDVQPPLTSIQLDLRQIIYALSDALDLVGIDDVSHGKRVGVMAIACAQTLGMPEQDITTLFDLGMLHDIGVSSTQTHSRLIAEFDWKRAQQHCETGYKLLSEFPPLSALAEPVRYHHTPWNILCAMPGLSPDVADFANLICLVDRVDTLAIPHYSGGELLYQTTLIRQKILKHAGSFFAPRLVDAFIEVSTSEAFWLQLEPRGLQGALQDQREQSQPCTATLAEIKQLATIFSSIVDAKSPFTAQHSLGVAGVARLLAERMGVCQENCEKLEIAGLLHDLGKLRVPDEVLDKPGALDERERKIINAHSFETYQILRHIHGFKEIASWAACHHEEPDGSGYPFHLLSGTLPLEARILRVADIFQAMAQDRPYRSGLPSAAVLSFLQNMVAQCRIDGEIVAAAAQDMQGVMAAARPDLHVSKNTSAATV